MDKNVEKNIEKIDYLPLGSVVIVRGNIKKLVIIARGLISKVNGELRCFDYGGVLYPEGLISEDIVYFNHKDLKEVIHKGYSDRDEENMVENLVEWFEKANIKHGEPYDINMQNIKNGKINTSQ